MAKEKKEKEEFIATLVVNNESLVSSANTLLEAINGLKPPFYKTKGILTVSKGDKSVQRLFFIPQMKRLFGEFGATTREIARMSTAKMLEQMLK